MANRWGKVEIVTDFIFLGSKITPDGDCSHEIKRCLLLGRKTMTNLDSVLKATINLLKSRDITLPTKVHIVKAMGWEDPLEKEMATHSSTLAGKSHGLRSLVGYSPWGRKESDTTKQLHSLTSLTYILVVKMCNSI